MSRRPSRGGKQKGSSGEAASGAVANPGGSPGAPTEPAISSVGIVGIGASAGGLAAFEAFFSAMPADTNSGLAFVLVQHLAPNHKSILSELIGRYTQMNVFEIEDGMAVQSNSVYIIPPNRDLSLFDGALHLAEPSMPRGMRLPIDSFFRSLAQDQKEQAIGIVLSGTGSDGTLGARAIKGEGGMLMAQTPESTQYDGMPRSVISTGLVDYVLPPAEMPAQLLAFYAQAFGRQRDPVPSSAPRAVDALQRIFNGLRVQTGHDFSRYKRSTIQRRIERRMAVHQIPEQREYARYIQEHPAEVDALFRDLLIGVTSFFRDREAFATFEEHAIPRLFDRKPSGTPIRIWVPGCSTGEEAYSIAILIRERMEALKQSFNVEFFATDIDPRGIACARAGVYPANVAVDISPERLSRFFVEEPSGGGYRIHKTIRDMLVFSEQDVIKDPPFSRLDVISCRNLLIYLDGELHKRLIPLFHYALNPAGVLFLGTSESVGEFGDLFDALDRRLKLYQRKEETHGPFRPETARVLPPMTPRGATRPFGTSARRHATPLRELTERALLQQLSQTGALINEHGDILYLHGRTGQYLEPAPGEAALNIFKMAREGLVRDLTSAVRHAVAQHVPVRRTGLRVKTNGDFSVVNVTVQPVEAGRDSSAESNLYLVILEDASDPERPETLTTADPGEGAGERAEAGDAHIAALRQELRSKEEYLQTTNEELETSNEELKSSNEEMQSVNEELQSTNEEMETSKEELQSVNEELATVNAELQTKVADLSQANNDMNNLLSATGVGTVFVDHQRLIQRFTPAITQVINLIPTDVGRPVGHIVSNLVGYDRLMEDVQAVLDTLMASEVEVQTVAGVWYLLRIRPYRTLDNVIEGAVISFTDITELKKAQAQLQESEALRHLAVVVRDADDAILVLDFGGRITAWNPGAVRLFGWGEAEALTMNILDVIPEARREEELARLQRLARAEVLDPFRAQRITKDGRVVDVWVTLTALLNASGAPYAIAATVKRAAGAGA
jgi:two-component system CheB/CheR fusion protein